MYSYKEGDNLFVALNHKGQRVYATHALKKEAYYCPDCKQRVQLKQGHIYTPHFAHMAQSACTYHKVETMYHREAKWYMYRYLKSKGYRVALEPYIPAIKQYPDLCVDNKYAIEIQFSPLSVRDVMARSDGLRSQGLHVVWIIPPLKMYDGRVNIKRRQRVFIHSQTHMCYSFDVQDKTLLRYSHLYYLGGRCYAGRANTVSLDQLFETHHKFKDDHVYQLDPSQVHAYLASCRKARSVLQPVLSMMYQMRVTDDWVARHCSYIFPEQWYIETHPIEWQLRYFYMKQRGLPIERCMQSLKLCHYYDCIVPKTHVRNEIIRQFEKIIRNKTL